MSDNDSSNISLETQSDAATVKQKPIWPVFACGLGMTIAAVLGFIVMESRWYGWNRYGESVIIGFLLTEIGLATIVGGLITRHWLTGWLLAISLACLQTVLAVLISAANNPDAETALRHLALCSLWPVFFLATFAPLVILRTLWGWTLARGHDPAIPRVRSSLEDLILVGVVIACAMTASQMFMFSEGPQSLAELLMIMCMFAATSLICVPPVIYVTFRSRNWRRRIVGWLVLLVILLMVIFVQGSLIDFNNGGFSNSIRFLPDMILGVVISGITVAIAMIALMASGYQLTYFAKATENNSTLQAIAQTDAAVAAEVTAADPQANQPISKAPFDAEWLNDSQPKKQTRAFQFTPQWQARGVALLLACVAAMGGLGIRIAKTRILNFYEEMAQLDVKSVHITKQSVAGLCFGPEFVDADVQKYLKYRDSIVKLSFAGTKVTDALLPELKKFPRLQELDLSGTNITDVGIRELRTPEYPVETEHGLHGFLRLSLADTKVTWAGAQELSKRIKIQNIDLSGLQISDEDLAEPVYVAGLRLSRNPITDTGLSSLLEARAFDLMDVSDSNVTGSAFISKECPPRLVLDGTPVTDGTLTQILRKGKVTAISLQRTSVTAAVLPLLVGRSLRLGKGQITENDLATMRNAVFQHLSLNDKQFTGKCMANANASTSSLDLSGSSVTDDVLMALLNKKNWYQYLGVANTQVSDASMPYLQSVLEFDIRGTRVTAVGLGSRPVHRVVVDRNQFSPKDMASMQNSKIEFSNTPMYNLWPE